MEGGFRIMVSAEKSLPLLTMLRAMPPVVRADKQIVKKENIVNISLKEKTADNDRVRGKQL